MRVHDISDPFQPKEIAYYVSAAPEGTKAGSIQINDVYVDENQIVYAMDRFAGGLYTFEMTGVLRRLGHKLRIDEKRVHVIRSVGADTLRNLYNIADATILANMGANAQLKQQLGIAGHPNFSGNVG